MEEKHDTIESLIVFFTLVEAPVKKETPATTIDPVTGLFNYAGFMEELKARVSLAKAGTEPFCCTLVHVENLDMLTLEKGFALRDELMVQLAKRITSTLPQEWAMGRVADDRFALASPLERTRAECAAALEKVARLLKQHLIWESQYIAPLIRTGTAYSDQANTARALLDTALAAFTTPPMGTPPAPLPDTPPVPVSMAEPEPIEEHTGPSPVAHTPSLETQTVSMYYQPQVYLKDGYLRGFHVYAVYETSPYGRTQGDELLTQIGEKRLVVPFMKALLTKALKEARQWHALYAKRLIVMCTLPPQWLREPELPAIVKHALTESTLAADYVELYIPYTKQHPWTDGDREPIEQLKELGVRIAASGLASGAMPLDTAVSPPYNTLVMVRSLVAHAGESEKFRTLIGNIVQLGRKAGKDILALGIDGHNDLRMLRQKGCPYGQGMLIGGPVAEEDLAKLLIDGLDLPS